MKGTCFARNSRNLLDVTKSVCENETSIWAWVKKGSGTVVRSTHRAVPATVPDPFLNHASIWIYFVTECGISRGNAAAERLVTDPTVNPNGALDATSTSLLRRVKAQDQEAWTRLVSLYHPLVYRWCRQAGLQEADAVDVGQEAFCAVSRSMADFRHDRPGDTFRGWLRRITQNKLRDHFLTRRPELVGIGGDAASKALSRVPSDDGAELGDPTEEARYVYRRGFELIGCEFEEQTREAFRRVVLEYQLPEDVARDLGMTVNAVYLAKSRILRRLREEFEDLIEL
jgi:RNA polymerase sigma-70 factor (ECF subfamily)